MLIQKSLSAILATREAELYADEPGDMGAVMSRWLGGLLLALGVVLLGGGTLVISWGWNTLNHASQMRGMVTAAFREVAINQLMIFDFPPLQGKGLDSRLLYPAFESGAAREIVLSNAFGHLEIADHAERYRSAVSDMNRRFEVSNQVVATLQDVEALKRHREHLLESRGYQDFLRVHNAYGKFLVKEYPWVGGRDSKAWESEGPKIRPAEVSDVDCGSQ